MNKFAVLILSTALAVSASAQSKVPSRMVSVVQQPVMAPASTTLVATLQWQNDNWPTNIDITAQYWETDVGKAYVATQGFATTSDVAHLSYMPGTNIVGAAYNTNGTWAVDTSAVTALSQQMAASPGVADYMFLDTPSDVWFRVYATTSCPVGPASDWYTGFVVTNQYTNLLSYESGIISIPTGYVALVSGRGKLKVNNTNQVSAALQFFNVSDTGATKTPEYTVLEYLYDPEDYYDAGVATGWRYGPRAATGTYFKATPRANERRIAMGATFTYGIETANTKVWAMWTQVYVMLFKIPVH